MRQHLANAFVALLIAALLLGAYDRLVRQPRTPRLAVVDITHLYEAVQADARRQLLDGAVPPPGSPASATAPAAAAVVVRRTAEGFGLALQEVLKGLSSECRCAIVAMAAVVGGDASIPDYTAEAAQRLAAALQGRQP